MGIAGIMAASVLAGCGEKASDGETKKDSVTYAFLAKDVQNPYMQKVYEGFERACEEVGAKALYKGPETATPEKQIEIINQQYAQ